MAQSAEDLGGIDILIANVSALPVSDDEAAWQAGFATDMMQRGRLVNAALPMLEASDAASITLVSSVSGREIDFTGPAYGAFKAALVHCAQGLAYKLAGKGIHANTVSPGNTHFEGGTWQQIETGNPELFAQALWPISLMGRSVRRWPNRRNRGHSRFGQPRGSAASCRSRRLEMATPGASARSRRTATNGCCTPSRPVLPQEQTEQTPITHAERATGRGRPHPSTDCRAERLACADLDCRTAHMQA